MNICVDEISHFLSVVVSLEYVMSVEATFCQVWRSFDAVIGPGGRRGFDMVGRRDPRDLHGDGVGKVDEAITVTILGGSWR